MVLVMRSTGSMHRRGSIGYPQRLDEDTKRAPGKAEREA